MADRTADKMVDRGGVCEAFSYVVDGPDLSVHIVCDPCNFEGTVSEAMGFCTQCQEYLCTDCMRVHKKSKALRRHNILQGSDLPTSRCQTFSTDDSVLCDFHHKDITKFCASHNVPLCDVCLVLDHSKCKVVTDISQVSNTDAHPDKVDAFLCYIKTLTEEFKELGKENVNRKENITKQKQECYDRIKTFRQVIHTFLDKLEKEIRLQVDRAVEENMKTLSNRMTTIEQALKVLDLAGDNIDNAKQVGEKCTFVSLNKLRPRVENTEDRLIDTVKEEEDIKITFKVESMLKDLLSKCTQFGTITVERTYSCPHDIIPGYLKDGRVEMSCKVNVKVDEDEKDCWITGIHVLDSGDTLLCDRNNETVKLMDTYGQIISSLIMESGPRDVTGIGNGEAAVTLPDQNKIEIVRIEGRQLTLQKGRDMTYHRDKIIPDKQGHLVRKIPVHQRPYKIVVDGVRRMYLSDVATDTSTCMTLSGKAVHTSTNAETDLNSPSDLLVDGDQEVYCVRNRSDNLHTLPDGNLYRTPVQTKEGMNYPKYVSYRGCDKTLIVGTYDDNIQLFKYA